MAFFVLKRKISNIGFKGAILFTVKRIYSMLFYSRTLFFMADLSNYKPKDRDVNSNVEIFEKKSFDQLTLMEKESLKEYGGEELLEAFKKKLSNGYRLFLTYLNNEVAGASWIYEGGENKFFMIPLSKGQFFILSVFILDKFRQKGIGTASLVQLLNKMRAEDFICGFICTKEWNFYQKAILKAGFKPRGKFYELKLLKWVILIWSSIENRPIDY